MGKVIAATLTLAGLALGALALALDSQPEERRFFCRYEAEIGPLPKGSEPVDVFVPLASTDSHQWVDSRRIVADIPGREDREPVYGNAFWHGRFQRSDGRSIHVAVDYEVRRRAWTGPELAAESPASLRKYLEPDRLVPVGGLLFQTMLGRLPLKDRSLRGTARAIYQHVLENMEYRKTGDGWGRGDALWACSSKYGNCTDFHAVYTSLARTAGIPTRFEIGFPIPEDTLSGQPAGYHCWLSIHLPGEGWVPVDASEGWKAPERRELFFGSQPPDRIKFSAGRDLRLNDAHAGEPLNFFVYPHVQVGGRPFSAVKTRFTYKVLGRG